MMKYFVNICLSGLLLCAVFTGASAVAQPTIKCDEIGADFYRCTVTNMCSDYINWSAPDDILVYPSGGAGSTMGLIQDRDTNGCIVAVAWDNYSSARLSTCGTTTVSSNCLECDPPKVLIDGKCKCPPPSEFIDGECIIRPKPRVTCEEIEPDFYRCVAHNVGEGQIRWTAPDDILVYPSGGVGSTMALIRDRDINGCIVAVAEGTLGSARYRSCSP